MRQMDKKECSQKVRCNVFAFCCTNEKEGLHCWEMAEAQNDFHYQYNICRDCFIYLHTDESSPLTTSDIEQIILARASASDESLSH